MKIKLKDICKSKIRLDLKKFLPNSQCFLGNAALLPLADEEKYLLMFREFKYKLPSYEDIYTASSSFEGRIGLVDNDFMPINPEQTKNFIKFDNKKHCQVPIIWDTRLFVWNDEIYCSGSIDRWYMYIGKIHQHNYEFTLDILYEYSSGQTEKNWLAIPGKPFNLIYRVEKGITSVIDIQTNSITAVKHFAIIDNKINELRGNTPLLQINSNEFVAIFHIRQWLTYIHYFLVFDRDSRLIHISKPFAFDSVNETEFPISMFYTNKSDQHQICITVSEKDQLQYVYIFDKQDLIDFIYSNLVEFVSLAQTSKHS